MAALGSRGTIADHVRDRVIPAVPVPFGADGAIDEELQTAYVKWMARQPIGGVAVWAHTGRGMRLSNEQRECVLRTWRSGFKRKPLFCGVGVPESVALPSAPAALTDVVIRSAVDLAKLAVHNGADAVLVHPPRALEALSDVEERVFDYHRAICATGAPAIAFYLYEAAGGISYSPRLVERLLCLDGVIGIKVATLDSVMTYQDVLAVVHRVPNALAITGEDRFLGYSLMAGARSALVGLGAAATDCSAALLRAWAAADWERFLPLSSALDAFARVAFVDPMDGYVQRMLWALEADGVWPRAAIDPWCPVLPSGERERVFAAVAALRSR